MTTGTWSAVSCTSNSTCRSPRSTADCSAGSVFSGISAALPRCAMISGSGSRGVVMCWCVRLCRPGGAVYLIPARRRTPGPGRRRQCDVVHAWTTLVTAADTLCQRRGPASPAMARVSSPRALARKLLCCPRRLHPAKQDVRDDHARAGPRAAVSRTRQGRRCGVVGHRVRAGPAGRPDAGVRRAQPRPARNRPRRRPLQQRHADPRSAARARSSVTNWPRSRSPDPPLPVRCALPERRAAAL